MKLLFFINTEAQVHTWRNLIEELSGSGHETTILARDYGSTLKLLDAYNLKYVPFKPIRVKYAHAFAILPHIINGYPVGKGIQPSIVIGFGIDAAVVAKMLGKPGIIFIDSEPLHLQNYLTHVFADVILTPSSFTKYLGKKQVRFGGYKELAYLHPSHFTPDPSILNELRVKKGEKYVILRLNAFDAVHDIGKKGFSTTDRSLLVEELGKYARVFISPEAKLPEDLEQYTLPIPFERIHHALYYAHLIVSDAQTMTTEAAILGTAAVRCNSFVGPDDMGNFVELEQKYDMIYSFREADKARHKALELIQQPDLKENWAKKRERLLADKIDVNKYMLEFIENYPKSVKKYKQAEKKK